MNTEQLSGSDLIADIPLILIPQLARQMQLARMVLCCFSNRITIDSFLPRPHKHSRAK